jgi:branched-chain amino acid transport system ATP-binding protein
MSLLEATHITKTFAGTRALEDVDVRVDAGELVGLIGPNGAGKTTLFNCIYGVLKPDRGTILLDGRDISHAPVYRRARLGLGRTFQRIELFAGMSVRDHLVIAERTRAGRGGLLSDLIGRGRTSAVEREKADHMLALLGLERDAERPIEALSLGRGRLVELGRALMLEPRLLFLDEPSSGLDGHETAEMADVLVEVQREKGTAILIVEHDIVTVQRLASRLYVLDYGTLIASGTTAEVMADSRVRAAYLGVGA